MTLPGSFRYRRRPTAEAAAAFILFVVALGLIILFFTGRSDNGGVPSDTPSAWTIQDSGTANDLLNVSFPDATHGWAVGEAGTILHTSDAGATWTLQNSGTELELAEVVFVDADTGWAVGKFGTILHTSDGGGTWKRQADSSITLDRSLIAVSFVDELTGLAFTERGSFMLATRDGGKTWTREFFSNTSNRSDVYFIDSDRGWVSQSQGGVLRTRDGGETWTLERGVTGARIGTTQVFFLNEQLGWISGWRSKGQDFEFALLLSDGMIARTIDGGRSWERHDTGTGRFVWDVEFVSELEGWAVGSFGSIVYSSDGGISWTEKPSPVETLLRAVTFADKKNGWAVGNDGTILKFTRP